MIVFVQHYFPFDDAFSYDGAGVSGRKELIFSAIYLENDWIFPAVFPKTADFFFLGCSPSIFVFFKGSRTVHYNMNPETTNDTINN